MLTHKPYDFLLTASKIKQRSISWTSVLVCAFFCVRVWVVRVNQPSRSANTPAPACELFIFGKKSSRSDQTLVTATGFINSNWFKSKQLVAATSHSNLLLCTCRATGRWDQIIQLTNQMPNQTVSVISYIVCTARKTFRYDQRKGKKRTKPATSLFV